MTDAEWDIIAPFMPSQCYQGGRAKVDLRLVVNAILYIAGDRLPMAGVAEGLSAALDRPGLLLSLARRLDHGIGSIAIWCGWLAKRSGATPLRPPASSTVKA